MGVGGGVLKDILPEGLGDELPNRRIYLGRVGGRIYPKGHRIERNYDLFTDIFGST